MYMLVSVRKNVLHIYLLNILIVNNLVKFILVSMHLMPTDIRYKAMRWI